ncbi:tyrosyl-tRNA synthetase, partial [Gonapodya sp. JEL0774]
STLRLALLKSRILFDTDHTSSPTERPMSSISARDIEAAFRDDPRMTVVVRGDLVGQEVVKVAVEVGAVVSKSQALKLIHSGGFYLNDVKCTDPTRRIVESDLVGGRVVLMRTGKSNYRVVVEGKMDYAEKNLDVPMVQSPAFVIAKYTKDSFGRMTVEEQLASALGEHPPSFASLDAARGRLRDDGMARCACLEAAIHAKPVPVEMIHFLTETAAEESRPIVEISLMVLWALERDRTEALQHIIMHDETLVKRLVDDAKFVRGEMLLRAVKSKSLASVTNVVTEYLPRLQAVSGDKLSSSDFAAGVERALWLPDPTIFEWLITEKSVILSSQILGAALNDALTDDSTRESVNIHRVRRVLSAVKDDIPDGFGTLSVVAVSRIALPAGDELDAIVIATLRDRFLHGPKGISLAAKNTRSSQKLAILSILGADGTTADKQPSDRDSTAAGTAEEADTDSTGTDVEAVSDSIDTDEEAEEDYVVSDGMSTTDELVRFFKRWVPTLAPVDDASKVLSTGTQMPAYRERILSAAFAQRNLGVHRCADAGAKHLQETGDVHFVDQLAATFPDNFARSLSAERKDFLLHAVRANEGFKLTEDVFRHMDSFIDSVGATSRGVSFLHKCRAAFVGIEFSADFAGLTASSLAKIIFPVNDDLDMEVISKARRLDLWPSTWR